MFKILGKLKAGKDKPKREKSERHAPVVDDRPPPLSKKEKEKPLKTSHKTSKKKRLHGASSTGDVSLASDDQILNRDPSQLQSNNEDSSEIHPTKPKKQLSKSCEEAVNKAVQDFFENAWMACAERFFISSAPTTVSYELRNTWLRIVEAEWQEPDLTGKPCTKLNRIFKKDEPPLPLAYDTWSRGALENLPQFRRESVMDPFLRDIDDYAHLPLLPIPDRLPSMFAFHTEVSSSTNKSVDGEQEEEIHSPSKEKPPLSENQAEKKSETEIEDDDAEEGEKWDFDLDQTMPDIIEPSSTTVPPTASEESVETSQQSEIELKPLETVFSARPFSLEESTTEVEESSTHSSDDSIKKRYRRQLKKFNPSQCGGKQGSGVFRFAMETSSEAAIRIKDATTNNVTSNASQFVTRNALEDQDIVRLDIKKGLNIQQQDDEYVVQPLFEERTPRHTSENSIQFTQRDNEKDWLRRSDTSTYFVTRKSATLVASDLNKRLLSRRLINLNSRFKRQAMRTLPNRAKQRETRKRSMQNPGSPPSSTNSSIFSKASSNRRAKNEKKSLKPLPARASASSINMLRNRSVAKGAASEPHLQVPAGSLKNLKHGKQNLSGVASSFKKIGNVRSSHQDIHGGKFHSRTKLPPMHLHTHIENVRNFQRGGDQGSVCCRVPLKTPSDCQSAASCCSNANMF